MEAEKTKKKDNLVKVVIQPKAFQSALEALLNTEPLICKVKQIG